MLGVLTVLFPNTPTSPYPRSSARNITILGLKLRPPARVKIRETAQRTTSIHRAIRNGLFVTDKTSRLVRLQQMSSVQKSVIAHVHVFLYLIYHVEWIAKETLPPLIESSSLYTSSYLETTSIIYKGLLWYKQSNSSTFL